MALMTNSVDLLREFRNITPTADLQAFESELMTGAQGIINKIVAEGLSIDTLFKVFNYLFKLGEKISNTVMLECKGHLSMKNEEIYHDFAMDYIEYSNKMLHFCFEMENFLSSARDRHSYIEHTTRPWINMESDVVQEDVMKIYEVLKNLKASDVYEQCAGNLLEKVQILMEQQQQMFSNLKQHIQTLGEEKQTTGHWKKVTSTVLMAIIGALLIGMIVALYKGNPKAAASLFVCTVGVGAGSLRVLDIFKAYEAALLVQKNAVNSMIKEGNMIVIMELQDIERLINKIVREIDSLVFNIGFAAKGNVGFGMKDIKRKLDNFLKKIEDLEAKTTESSSRIMREREEFRTTLNSNNSFTRGELVDNASSSLDAE
ncbi:hypothetical protein M0R45_008671 [Rubus argutus]|uniref:Uncharacterized protein n=1 Tax=Rubus argutus TaxID=59490 RepID=A0AAW1Y1Z4_RUBAR